jgi:hypothetical protein
MTTLAENFVAFCLASGLPTLFMSFNFAMLGFWAGLAIITAPPVARRTFVNG